MVHTQINTHSKSDVNDPHSYRNKFLLKYKNGKKIEFFIKNISSKYNILQAET